MVMSKGQEGFSLVEFLIATAIIAVVLGGTIMIAAQLQQVYSTQLDDVAVEEETRFAIDWIAEAIRKAGSNPYEIETSNCPLAGTIFQTIRIDPDADGANDDIRIQADLTGSPTAIPAVTGPDALLGGTLGSCNQAGEDITIRLVDNDLDPATPSVITRQDNNTEPLGATVMTDAIFTQLLFTYLTSAGAVTTNPDAIAYVRIRVTGQSEARNLHTAAFTTSTLETDVRVRTR
jgi:prepilin-type N-terminal cleavage/methylation domain-containing protein